MVFQGNYCALLVAEHCNSCAALSSWMINSISLAVAWTTFMHFFFNYIYYLVHTYFLECNQLLLLTASFIGPLAQALAYWILHLLQQICVRTSFSSRHCEPAMVERRTKTPSSPVHWHTAHASVGFNPVLEPARKCVSHQMKSKTRFWRVHLNRLHVLLTRRLSKTCFSLRAEEQSVQGWGCCLGPARCFEVN